MAVITIHSDFGAQENKMSVFIVFPSICHEVMEPHAVILIFWMLNFKPEFSFSSFTFINRLSISSSLYCHKGGIICVSEITHIFPAILIPPCASFNPAFHMMHSVYKLNNQSDNIQPWCIPFLILNQSVVLHPVQTVVSWPAYTFLRRHVR